MTKPRRVDQLERGDRVPGRGVVERVDHWTPEGGPPMCDVKFREARAFVTMRGSLEVEVEIP